MVQERTAADPCTPPRRALVVLSSVKWNFAWQRHHSLARAAAASGSAVVFVEPHPRSPRQVLTRIGRIAHIGGRGDSEGHHRLARRDPRDAAPAQAVPNGVSVMRWSPLDLLPGRTLRAIRRRLGRDGRDEVIVLQYVPSRTAFALARRLHPDRLIYDRVLDWAHVPPSWYPPRGWREVEAALEGSARLATDSSVMQSAWAARGLQSLLILPAADDEFVSYPWSEPDPGAPIGYFGTVQDRIIDLELLVTLARSRQIEIVGEVEEVCRSVLLEAGIRLRPSVGLGELPPIIDGWSAIILPYRVGERTHTLVPAKIWNALASARPVMTSGLALPEEIARHTVRLDGAGRSTGGAPGGSSVDLGDSSGVPGHGIDGPPERLERGGIPAWADAWRRLTDRAP